MSRRLHIGIVVIVLAALVLGACGRRRPATSTPAAPPSATSAPAAITPSPEGGGAVEVPSATSPPSPTSAPTQLPPSPPPTETATPTAAPGAFDTTRLGMLVDLSTVDEAQEALLAVRTGARYVRIAVEWADQEPTSGRIQFNAPSDRYIADIESAGGRVFPTLYIGLGWMNGKDPKDRAQGARSYPPSDLSAEWSEQVGHSPGYYNFVYQYFSHYRGHFDFVAIENEENSGLFWGGTADEYLWLLRTAYKAIKAADPDVQVTDGGFVSSAWGLCINMESVRSGVLSQAAADAQTQAYYAASNATSRFKIDSPQAIRALAQQPTTQEECRRIETIVRGVNGAVDVFNFHFYQGYDVMHQVTDWVHRLQGEAGFEVPMLSNEMGLRGTAADTASPEVAKNVLKSLVVANSLGLRAVLWFAVDTVGTDAPSPDKLGLFDPRGRSRPSAETFKMVAQLLTGRYRFVAAVSEGPGLYHYVFAEAGSGAPTLEALWTRQGSQEVSLSAPPGATGAVVVDFAGRSKPLDAPGGTLTLTVTDAPVFVQWR